MTRQAATIEQRSNTWMQAWVRKDRAVLEDCLAPDFTLVVSANPDKQCSRETWLATATSRYTCSEFRYREVQVRNVSEEVAVMSAIAEFTADIDGVPRNGPMFIIDVWRQDQDARWRVCNRYTAHPEPSGLSSEALQKLKP
ncbi:MAG: nuclear transport factor 2 family protein [Sphingomicrobium sp.]